MSILSPFHLSFRQVTLFSGTVLAAQVFLSAPAIAAPPIASFKQSQNSSNRSQKAASRPQFPSAGLAAVLGKGVTSHATNVAEADLGTVNPLNVPFANLVFTLRNTSDRPILIDRLQPSCGCTTASVMLGGKSVAAEQGIPALNPKAEVTIHIHIDLTGQAAGGLTKFVAVYIKDRPQPAAMLQIRGVVARDVSAEAPPHELHPFAMSTASNVLPPHKAPFTGLRVAPTQGIQALAPNQAEHDFGTVSALDMPSLEQTFLVTNGGSVLLVLDRLQPTCLCTTASVEGIPTGVALPTLAPGQKATIRVTVRLAGLESGPLLKSVMVFTQGNPRPAAVLTLTGKLQPAVTLSPTLLDFGQIQIGKSQALTLTASLDARLTQDGVLPILASNNPDIQITPQPDIIARLKPGSKSRPAPGGRPSATGSTPPGLRHRTYRIILTPSTVGPITGSLYFVPSSQNPAAAAALTTATVLLVGQATGDAAAQPQALSFGTARLGQGATRQLVLIGKTGATLASLRLSSASPWLSARLKRNDPEVLFSGVLALSSGAASQTNQVLEVTLSPDAPAGVLQSRIKVSLTNGQCLLIPVTAYVSAAPVR